MDITLKNAYTEVYQILEILGEEYKSKIPEKLQNLFQEQQNKSHKTNIRKSVPIDKMEVSRTALIIISILNLEYWETDETKKAQLKKVYAENEREFQEKISVYKQNDWLKNKKNEIKQEEKALIEQKQSSWMEKVHKLIL